MVTDKEYSVLSYNIGGYEKPKEVKFISPKAEYVYVTDDRSFTSNTWNVVYVDNKHPEDNFDLCYDIRFNPFKYVNTDTVIRIDGSMEVIGNTDELIEVFNEGNYDISLVMHPVRTNLFDEYVTWCKYRGYSVEQANYVLNFMLKYEGYDVKEYKGLYQYNFMIQRNNKINNDLNSLTLSLLKYLAEDGKQIERLDQTVGSFVINKYFNHLKVLPVDNRIAYSKYFSWYAHNSNTKFPDPDIQTKGYLFNKEVDTNIIKYD